MHTAHKPRRQVRRVRPGRPAPSAGSPALPGPATSPPGTTGTPSADAPLSTRPVSQIHVTSILNRTRVRTVLIAISATVKPFAGDTLGRDSTGMSISPAERGLGHAPTGVPAVTPVPRAGDRGHDVEPVRAAVVAKRVTPRTSAVFHLHPQAVPADFGAMACIGPRLGPAPCPIGPDGTGNAP